MWREKTAEKKNGRITYFGHVKGPPIPRLRRKKIFLTLTTEEDREILEQKGLASLRQARILRLAREAHDQGALLAYEDLTDLLLTSLSTLKRDLRLLKKKGFLAPVYRKKQRSV